MGQVPLPEICSAAGWAAGPSWPRRCAPAAPAIMAGGSKRLHFFCGSEVTILAIGHESCQRGFAALKTAIPASRLPVTVSGRDGVWTVECHRPLSGGREGFEVVISSDGFDWSTRVRNARLEFVCNERLVKSRSDERLVNR